MVVVDSVALAITVSNDLVMPILLRRRAAQSERGGGRDRRAGADRAAARRSSSCSRSAISTRALASGAALASIGLLSFAALAQIAPAFLGGLVWRRGTARGRGGGHDRRLAGLALSVASALARGRGRARACARRRAARRRLAAAGRAGRRSRPIRWSAASCSRSAPISSLSSLVSLTRQPTLLERTQARRLRRRRPPAANRRRSASGAPRRRSATSRRRSRASSARARAARVRRVFRRARRAASASDEADALLIRHAEHLLSPAIGASTSRLVLSLLLRRRAMSGKSALKMLDDASAAIQSSRDQLQHALDHARQGITRVRFQSRR